MPRRSFYDVNRQGATKYPEYDQADFEKARSTIRGPKYSSKMQDTSGAERGAPDEIAK